MSISYSINPTEKLVYVTFPEIVDLASGLDTMRALAADERLEEGFGILVDLRAAKPIPSVGEARLIAATASQSNLFLHYPTALVVSRKVQYGMGNMISIIAGLQDALVQAFYEVEEAKTWLQMHQR